MEWSDKAIILSASKHGENALIVRLLTKERGYYAGLVRGIRKPGAICQSGNLISVTWKARLEEHLGYFTCEMVKPYAALLMMDGKKLSALSSASTLIEKSLAEREPHPEIFESFCNLLEVMSLDDDSWLEDYVRFELELLNRLGYGLDLSHCADTGQVDDLIYVSPKSAQAVSATSGEPYKDKLLKLPSFLCYNDNLEKTHSEKLIEIIDGIALSRYFLRRYVFILKGNEMPIACEYFLQKLRESYES